MKSQNIEFYPIDEQNYFYDIIWNATIEKSGSGWNNTTTYWTMSIKKINIWYYYQKNNASSIQVPKNPFRVWLPQIKSPASGSGGDPGISRQYAVG
jgi:hypothetical protein